jgi:hypothetical protein
MSAAQQLIQWSWKVKDRSLMGQAGSVDKKIVEEEQMNNVRSEKKCLGAMVKVGKNWCSKSLVTYEPMSLEENLQIKIIKLFYLIPEWDESRGANRSRAKVFPMNFKLMVSHRENLNWWFLIVKPKKKVEKAFLIFIKTPAAFPQNTRKPKRSVELLMCCY